MARGGYYRSYGWLSVQGLLLMQEVSIRLQEKP